MDYVAWARRTNARWIVHHRLGEHAEAYLDHLAQQDPDRMERSCRKAYLLVHECPAGQDPKPWFYSGLFSLAAPAEVRHYLSNHWLVRMAVSGPAGGLAQNAAGQAVSEVTLETIRRIHEAVSRARSAT